jgi:fructose-bisphosphate aldolase, class II
LIMGVRQLLPAPDMTSPRRTDMTAVSDADFQRALDIGRPPNVKKLFPNSKALIVSGKAIDRAMRAKGKCMTIAANCRSTFILRGVLRAAQRADAAIIVEIARSEGGCNAYCPTTLWRLAGFADQMMNEMGITVPVAVHADHFGIKKPDDVGPAEIEIPTLFDYGVTSIAIDASHMTDDENLLASLALMKHVPSWAGYETEVGEIKGASGLSTPDEALFIVKGLNAHGISPDWIALNNGTTHGIEADGAGIQVGLTADIHKALEPYGVSGAQHGTSGNHYDRLRQIAQQTHTTKANVATALQMVSWGVKVNEFGNAVLGSQGDLAKEPGQGVTQEMWKEMTAYATQQGWSGGNYKKLNRVFENKLQAQPREIRERMVQAVEDFVFHLLDDVFNASGTAPLAVQALLDAGSHDLGPKAERIEDPAQWTEAKIRERAKAMDTDKGPEGDFDD